MATNKLITDTEAKKLLGRISLDDAIEMLGESKHNTFPSNDFDDGKYTEDFENGSIIYQFSDDEMKTDEENYPWDEDHMMVVRLDAECLSGIFPEPIWERNGK